MSEIAVILKLYSRPQYGARVGTVPNYGLGLVVRELVWLDRLPKAENVEVGFFLVWNYCRM
jgi:hypothetical protein